MLFSLNIVGRNYSNIDTDINTSKLTHPRFMSSPLISVFQTLLDTCYQGITSCDSVHKVVSSIRLSHKVIQELPELLIFRYALDPYNTVRFVNCVRQRTKLREYGRKLLPLSRSDRIEVIMENIFSNIHNDSTLDFISLLVNTIVGMSATYQSIHEYLMTPKIFDFFLRKVHPHCYLELIMSCIRVGILNPSRIEEEQVHLNHTVYDFMSAVPYLSILLSINLSGQNLENFIDWASQHPINFYRVRNSKYRYDIIRRCIVEESILPIVCVVPHVELAHYCKSIMEKIPVLLREVINGNMTSPLVLSIRALEIYTGLPIKDKSILQLVVNTIGQSTPDLTNFCLYLANE